jgi:hypothetical protein
MLPLPKPLGGLGLHFGIQNEFKTPDWYKKLYWNFLNGDAYQSYLSTEAFKAISMEKLYDRGVPICSDVQASKVAFFIKFVS